MSQRGRDYPDGIFNYLFFPKKNLLNNLFLFLDDDDDRPSSKRRVY